MWSEPLYTAAEMRAAEEAYEGPTLELMERAGTAAAEAALRHYPDARRIAVWCGGGSNGGDGLVVARKLREARRDVEARLAVPEEKLRGDAGEMLKQARESGVPIGAGSEADLVIDAVYGTGFSGAPRRPAVRLL
jgi:ADP-dependent NAD(P)H-hydrate dehydratase / NAD(P)H-hydrate epimerase